MGINALSYLKGIQDRMKEDQAALQEALRLQNQTLNDFTRMIDAYRPSTCYEDDLVFMERTLQAMKNIGPCREALEAARDRITTNLERNYLFTESASVPAETATAKPKRTPRVVNFDEELVEEIVLEILCDGPQRKSTLITELNARNISFSKAGLERILHACPSIEIAGERDQTRYKLRHQIVSVAQ